MLQSRGNLSGRMQHRESVPEGTMDPARWFEYVRLPGHEPDDISIRRQTGHHVPQRRIIPLVMPTECE
jgi:hypothetical protein